MYLPNYFDFYILLIIQKRDSQKMKTKNPQTNKQGFPKCGKKKEKEVANHI
jgi:hypothetical protein